MTKMRFGVIAAVICLSLTAGDAAFANSYKSTTSHKQTKPQTSREIADPIEPFNRFMFGFNDVIDHLIIEPLARGYRAVLPQFVRNSVQSFMRNLESPIILANNLLQGNIGDAGITVARFAINSTVGIGGLVDVAKAQGLSYKSEDFGQTLAKWGAGDGFYLVLPIFGPSSLRDTAGLAVDSFADPVRIVTSNMDEEWIYYTRGAVYGIDTRARMIPAIDDLRRNSLDYYAATRSAYIQKRKSLIRDEEPNNAASPANQDFPQ